MKSNKKNQRRNKTQNQLRTQILNHQEFLHFLQMMSQMIQNPRLADPQRKLKARMLECNPILIHNHPHLVLHLDHL